MDLSDITPLILTKNEEANLDDTLRRLQWADRIVVIDSGSDDATLEIASRYDNVEVFYRDFDNFAGQCNYGLSQINTEWVLSIDADYRCPIELIDEIQHACEDGIDGYEIGFTYCVLGRELRSCLYPARTVLYRAAKAGYVADGHAHRVQVAGKVSRLRSRIQHDDHKPFATWLAAQRKYAVLEADKLLLADNQSLRLQDRLRRKYFVAPLIMFFYCLFYRRLILDGWQGAYYTMQRVYAELILGMELLDRKLRADALAVRDNAGGSHISTYSSQGRESRAANVAVRPEPTAHFANQPFLSIAEEADSGFLAGAAGSAR